MTLQVYNVLSRRKEPFQPGTPDQVTLYVCGPTVYAAAHVGHAMSAIVFDIIRRYLAYRGYTVHHMTNYTDVDDKIIERAHELAVPPLDLAQGYIDEFDQHLRDLNCLPATSYPRATNYIAQMIDFIQGLVDGGFAYPADDGSVYFRVEKAADYGKLSGRKLEDMLSGARLEINDAKEAAMDFVLWKAAKPGEPQWDSPWGPGRPGWHIECSVMARTLLGDTIDIHGGGNDLLFPHHENELAQSESLTGKPFARYWLHNGMLQLKGEKMSKSLGNLVTVKEFLAEHDADVFRLIVLGSSYRGPLTFNDAVIEQAESALDRLLGALRLEPGTGSNPDAEGQLAAQIESMQNGFVEAMDNDFNTAGALSQLFALVRAINQARDAGASPDAIDQAKQTLRDLGGVLGLRLQVRESGTQADPFVDLLVEVRVELRNQKQWALADTIRDRLNALGVIVEDAAEGSSWRWK